MATKAPYCSLTGSQLEVVRKFSPKVAIASRAPWNTVRKMPSSTMATVEASSRVSCRNPRSTSFSAGGRRRRVNASAFRAGLGSVGMGVRGFASVSAELADPCEIYELPLAGAFKW